ncbi:hypothetical protein X777_13129 [Ooceraea biroi]|uniref:Uncharacterized protein n=1 Tax=Ooceraea biroi TaxID=2015173 RepID=A0A026WY08_OOCBI|nr:hypothetical protein X777_13129 [Ooceraea biroi]
MEDQKDARVEHCKDLPDLTPCNFWLFPKLKLAIKKKRYDTIQDTQRGSTTVLETIPKTEHSNHFKNNWLVLLPTLY